MDIAEFINPREEKKPGESLDELQAALTKLPASGIEDALRAVPAHKIETCLLGSMTGKSHDEVLREMGRREREADQVAKLTASLNLQAERAEEAQRRHARLVAEELAAAMLKIESSPIPIKETTLGNNSDAESLQQAQEQLEAVKRNGVAVGERKAKKKSGDAATKFIFRQIDEILKMHPDAEARYVTEQIIERIGREVQNKQPGRTFFEINREGFWFTLDDTRAKSKEKCLTEDQLTRRIRRHLDRRNAA
ncbi:MAG: hypothetical protein KJZ92_14285 [Rhodocyclaceae bacterium]|nr:hypothetical protein [Rhodocyclaceae bacterium]